MIEMDSITKCYMAGDREVPILKGITMNINRGEFISIMGPSGSGKSTLSSILGCLSTPTSGTYSIGGQLVSNMTPNQLARLRNRKIGFIFQDFNLLEGLNAVDNVALPLFYSGVSTRERKRRALDTLKQVGLGHRSHHYPRQLSGGQKQRVAIARALVTKPVLLFGDEPTGALDKKTGDEIMGLMQHLNYEGQTIIQVTHSLLHSQYSKRILHLVDGLIVRDEMVARPLVGGAIPDITGATEIVHRLWQVAQASTAFTTENLGALSTLYHSGKDETFSIEAAKTFMRWKNPDADGFLTELFKSEHWTVRAEIVKTCPSRGPVFALPYLITSIQDESPWVRYLAVSEIKKMGKLPFSPEDRKILLGLFDDSDERVRATLLAVIPNWEEITFMDNIIAAAEDKDGRVRANALDALGMIAQRTQNHTPEVVDVFRNHLEDKNNRARANAALWLAPHAPDLAFESLTKQLWDENNLIRASSGWALGLIKEERAPKLLIDRLCIEKEDMVLSPIIRSLGKHSEGCLPLTQQVNIILERIAAKKEEAEAA